MDSLFLDVISLDWDDTLTLILALTAVIGMFVKRRSSTETKTSTEVVDGDVLSQFRDLFEKIANLEAQVALQQVSLDKAHAEIKEMRKIEAFLEGQIHDREKRITVLEAQLTNARSRIAHLEQVCKRAGINGDELNGVE